MTPHGTGDGRPALSLRRAGAFLSLGGLVGVALLVSLSLAGATANAAFPGQNGKIVCDGQRGSGPPDPPPAPGPPNAEVSNSSEIYSMNPDGSAQTLLTRNPVVDADPTFSADGRKIAFESRLSTSFSTVHTMNADGTGVTRVVTGRVGATFESTWSPDGASIAFMDGSQPNFEVSRVRADGTDYRPLTTNPAQDGRPAWSPDGARIAFTSSREGNFEIFLMNPESGDASPGETQQVTNTDPPIQNTMPNWSPDGTKIVFATSRDGVGIPNNLNDDNLEIYTVNSDGSDLRRLTANAADDPTTSINEAADERPAWSPDGTKIVFSSRRTGDAEVYTMNAADGGGLTRLTNSPGFDLRCDWGRVADTPKGPPPPFQPAPATPFAGCPASTANVMLANEASNSIVGTILADRIFAGTGNDTVDGLAGNDCIDLGPGDDRGQGGDGDDLLVGGLGRDRMSGSAGADRLLGGGSGDSLIGGFGDDRLHGQSGSDRVNGERGRDRINGGSSNDVISAGSSGDRVAGDQGNDRINGNSGNDLLKGNSGRDRIKGSSGRDRISGGSGGDRIDARDGRRDRVKCGSGRDRVVADRTDRVARDCERVSRRG